MLYSFDEIMEYHPDNLSVYKEIERLVHRLVPFVGAGLTKFAYYSWPDALTELSRKLTNTHNIRRVRTLIRNKDYLDAAQLLEDLRTPVNLAHDIANLFSSDRLEQKRTQLQREPIALLPLLFPDLVLTTNYDETLETVYRESDHVFQSVSLPGHPELLKQYIRQGGTGGLLKLHGTVTGRLIEYGKIVFTLKQYDKHYGDGSPLTEELKTCFKGKMMLFLGCSLEKDRTMELLQKVIGQGEINYAVISCKKSERDKKIKELGDKNIRAILYKSGCHEAVRVILEHLLETIEPAAYKSLPVHLGALKSLNLSARFSYKAEVVPFVGRKDELQQLNQFLGGADIAFRWWAVIGPGGSGKSRLAYEFQKRIPSTWKAHYLGANDYSDLSSLTEQFTQKTLLIADYVQENARALGKWMEQLNEKLRCLPVRVLLVERAAESSYTDGEYNNTSLYSPWTQQLFMDTHYEQQLKASCYQDDFLFLPNLNDDDLMDIIGNYAAAIGQADCGSKTVLSVVEKKQLLQKLKTVDPQLCRPLYAMFLTDAYMEGKDPQQWNREHILDYVIIREHKRLEFNIRQSTENENGNEKLYAACLYLQSVATVFQNASLDEIQTFCPETWNTISEALGDSYSPTIILERIGLAVKGEILALGPDLIGEYFVYRWITTNRDEAKRFLRTVWCKPGSTAVFFERMIRDYGNLFNQTPQYWKLLLPDDFLVSEESLPLYAALIVNAVGLCSTVGECGRLCNLLEKLSLRYPNHPEIMIQVANGLVNLSSKQDEQGTIHTVRRLENFAEEYPAIPEITVALAKGLFNLSFEQAPKTAQQTISRLECLVNKYSASTEIVIAYAKSLINLSLIQDGDKIGKQRTIKRLECLVDKYSDNWQIAVKLAKGLYNSSNDADEIDSLRAVELLRHLAEQYSGDQTIKKMYTKCLVNFELSKSSASCSKVKRKV